MTSDRELLELAAKAAGLDGYVYEWVRGPYYIVPADPDVPRSEPKTYDWLNDDGDALRLAVKLGLDLCVSPNFRLCAWSEAASDWMEEAPGNDPCSAMRRAIVRAAAAIGGA